MNPTTIIAGAGLGGLTLAQGLRRVGLPVTVLERDASFDARPQGYRLHLDTRGARGLRASLGVAGYERVEQSAGTNATTLTIATTKLRTLKRLSMQSGGPTPAVSTSVDRATLRELLVEGIDVEWGAQVIGFEQDEDGVVARLEDGRELEGDVLVGADGVHSAIRRQLLPEAGLDDAGDLCLLGRTPLTDATALPPELKDGFMAVIGMRTLSMGLGLMAFRDPGLADRSYVMWSLAGPRGRFKAAEEQLEFATPQDLHALAKERTRKFDAKLQALVDAADPASCAIAPVLTAQEVGPWEPSRVTLLGDAIHAMSPAGGAGANMALQDAGLLAMTLGRAVQDDAPLTEAIGFYEERLREHGFAAVRESLVAMRRGLKP